MGLEMVLSQKQKIYPGRIQYAALLQMGQEDVRAYLEKEVLENPLAQWKRPPIQAEPMPLWQGPSLKQELLRQLPGLSCNRQESGVCSLLLEEMDSDGYFREDPEKVALRLHVPVGIVHRCVKLLQSLEPAGVFAKDLRQCLLLQLQRLTQDTEAEERIVSDHLELLGSNRISAIARLLELPVARIEQAAQMIRNLQPRPSAGYADTQQVVYAIPDVIVTEDCDVVLPEYSNLELTADETYAQALGTLDPETEQYLHQMKNRLQQLQAMVQQRQRTILRLAAFAVLWQEAWFRGESEWLRPLRLADAAWELGLSLSAVSRCVKDKYIRCRHGVIPLQKIFAKGIKDEDRAAVLATEQVKDALRRLIAAENSTKPYSDATLSRMLEAKGIKLSRRTVTKYRLAMCIPDSRERKV